MGGKEPEYIITDQDPGIIASVPENFKTARHRFCIWHIMNKVPCKYGSKRKDYQVFIKKLNAIVWDEELEAEEFDNRWSAIMEEHVSAYIEWFTDCYDIRRQWVMAHCKDLRMGGIMRTTQRSESENSFFKRFEARNGTLVEFWMRFQSALDQQRHNQKRLDNENRHSNPKLCSKLALESDGAKIYTHDIFEEFQEELKNAIGGFSCKGFLESNNLEVTTLKDSLGGRNFDVQYNPGTFEASCSCKLFERKGLLCRHIIWIYSDSKQLQMTKLWSEIHETIGVLVDKEKEDVEGLTNLIREFREKLTPVGEKLNKQHQMEKLLGCKASKETKGVGKEFCLVGRRPLQLPVSRNACAIIASKWHTMTRGTVPTLLLTVHRNCRNHLKKRRKKKK
ncbi:protein FAR-RED IMPAIRED RESPONSE 1-like [Silene latifolia]|uniref:protein FAR-RED IMPAIRED RESPONSE 1-like n=1 Tax=Silene latifolia TaxID=37657 RepID=UPI003D7895E8